MGFTMLDNRQIEANWPQIRTSVLTHWKKLSEREVEKTHGNANSLGKLVKSKYGPDTNFEQEYEQICSRIAFKARKTREEDFNELDDEDESGMTSFDDHSADYTGMKLNNKQTVAQSKPVKEVELPIKPEVEETGIKEDTEIKTAPDDFKPNQDPHFSQNEDISLGRSNSSANTTSPSALISSETT